MARRLLWLAAFIVAAAAPLASAQVKDGEAAPRADPARPAIGVWIGHVSWNPPLVTYVWSIYPHGFDSGRMGRGPGGGGAWSTSGDRLTLKYSNGFRYEGELHGDEYAGEAFRVDGRTQGGFSMHRADPNAAPAPDEAP